VERPRSEREPIGARRAAGAAVAAAPAVSQAQGLAAAPAVAAARDATVGVYVHVPYCERVCPYCDFAVVAARRLAPERERRYVAALLSELAARAPAFAGRRLASLYLGGGTPSLLRPESVARIVAAVRAAFPPRAGEPVEVTLETNPSTLERERLPALRAAGTTRVSVGIQSFDDAVLKRLGRAHRAAEGRATLAACRAAGFANLSFDLLFAAPGQDLATLERDLAQAVAFEPEHVSAYELSWEPETPFGRAAARGRLRPAPEELAVRMHEAVERCLTAAGFERYEISSYARPGFESAHNRRYWERRAVLALGAAAASLDPPTPEAPFGTRRANLRGEAEYLARIEAGRSAEAEPAEVLDARTARGEAALLALRTSRGLRAEAFAAEFGGPPRAFFAAAVERLRARGLLHEGPAGDLRLTPEGRLLSDTVFAELV
jgi:oxygen-independent coproporphyrinogen-3 oxidase